MESWQDQLRHHVNTLEKLSAYITVTDQERRTITEMSTRWGTTR